MRRRLCHTLLSSFFSSCCRCWPAASFSFLLALAGCGDLPRPFQGQPGANATRLAQPPPSRLAVEAAPAALQLSSDSGKLFADTLAAGLQALEIPADADRVQPGDWRLALHAESRGSDVVPAFTVRDPTGRDRGTTESRPVPGFAWQEAAPATLRQAAADAVPAISDLLTRIQAREQRADPNSLFNRPAKVFIPPVTGAPGDGNFTLTSQLRTKLEKLGPVVQGSAIGADFIVRGEVRVVDIAGHQQRVEIQWIISDATARERGRVVQLNEIPAGTLNRFWGDIAVVVATEASGGVRDVILTQSGRRGQGNSDEPVKSDGIRPNETRPVGIKRGETTSDAPS